MIYLVAILLPPLYFAIRKKWGACVFSAIGYAFALVFLIIPPVGIFIWFTTAVHAVWTLRKEVMQEHAQMIAKAIVEEQGKKAA